MASDQSRLRRTDDGQRHRQQSADGACRYSSSFHTRPNGDPDEPEGTEAALPLPPAVSVTDDLVHKLRQLVPRLLRVRDASSAARLSAEWNGPCCPSLFSKILFDCQNGEREKNRHL